ncbi:MAG: rhomboid family intramembrane serine protease [Bacteroidetes bacterium]|nr:MAG: rhomboid family intramembrane serine protease [Bacteroidota bacterium]
MSLLTEIKQNYIYSNHAVRRIIAINVLIFIVISMVHVFFTLFQFSLATHNLVSVFTLPAYLPDLLKRPWSLITYMFLHDGVLHLIFNMLWLYWMGNLLHEYLGNKRVYQAYFLGGIFGGLVYILAYNIFPLFATVKAVAFALGASAGVLSVTVAVATLLPDYEVKLLFFGFVRLKWIALIIVILDLLGISGGNAGGHIAHLGGAAFGFMFIRYLYKHTVFEGMFDKLAGIFKKKSRLKVHYKTTYLKTENGKKPSEHEIDLILDKINRSGYDSLSKLEKEQLFKASKD